MIVSLFFSEAIKESGKALGKDATDTFTILINTIREKFKAEGTEGLLTRAENQPTEHIPMKPEADTDRKGSVSVVHKSPKRSLVLIVNCDRIATLQ